MKKALLFRLIATRKLKLKDGLIDVQDQYFNLLPAVFISSLIEYYHSRDQLDELYLISWFWGYAMSQKIANEFGLEDPEEIYSFGMDFIKSQGLGLYCTDDYHPGKYTHFKIETNPYHRHLNLDKYNEPLDHFISGLMGGGGCIVHDALTQNIEVKCKTQGEPACEFVTGTREELKKRDLWHKVQERYNIERMIEFQREVHKDFKMENAEVFAEKLSELTKNL